MTVDETSFASLMKSNPRKAQELISQLRDVTAVTKDEEICRALDESRKHNGTFNLERATQILIDWNSEEHGRIEGGEDSMAPSPAVVMNPAPLQRPVVDLTEDKDDLQRAIALSLAEGSSASSTSTARPPGVSQEEQDVSKALEASLLESVGMWRTIDGANPNDRKRDGEWPVGLKNVGQTCWFSAVIQSFFHLPAFRALVLKFKPPQREPASVKERKILDFMLELRKLFSLLVGSQRKYVDPSRAVGILRGYLGGESNYCNNQQDVSEFTHKLLDWLEEAFKIRDKCAHTNSLVSAKEAEAMDAETEKCDKEKDVDRDVRKDCPTTQVNNPMFDLFYGKVKIEGKNQGIEFSREEQFGQWPLQVNGSSHIHDSLEASTAHEYIDSASQSDLQGMSGQLAVRKSGQERWFTKLPPVLFFELSRFQFNQERGRAEKINNFLDFPDVIYMDRYLELNKNITRSKRDEVKDLKEKREKLKTRLQSYLEYGDDTSAKIPLVNILNRTMQFARSGTDSASSDDAGLARDIDTSSPGNNAMQVDSPCPSPASLTPATSMVNLNDKVDKSPLKTFPDGSVQIPIRIENMDKNTPTPMEVEQTSDVGETKVEFPLDAVQSNHPTPGHVSELELKVLSACLSRWKQEIEEKLSSLNSALQQVETKISQIYQTSTLQQKEYKLHAVMVHEGDVNQGHYWAYVYHPHRKIWMKFNDNTVSETTWDAMKKESAGGRMSTSAYSMVYIDTSRPDLIRNTDTFVSPDAATRDMLPDDLELYVQEDNKCFAAEILNWDEELKKKGTQVDMSDGVLIGDDPECQIIESKSNLANSHAALAQSITNKLFAYHSTSTDRKIKTQQVISEVLTMANKKAKDGDHKLESFLIYVISVESPQDVVNRAVCEQLSLLTLDASTELARQVITETKDILTKCTMAEETIKWHEAYHNLRIASYYFVLGVEKYNENKYEESVELLTTSYIVNKKLTEEPLDCGVPEMKAMPRQGLVKYFHLAVEALNSHLVDEFEHGNNPSEVAARVKKILVPAIHILQARTNMSTDSSNRDASLLETVRGRWCALLESPMAPEKHEYWSTVFNTVVPDDNAVVIKQPLNLRYPKMSEDLKLAARFRSVMQTVLKEEN